MIGRFIKNKRIRSVYEKTTDAVFYSYILHENYKKYNYSDKQIATLGGFGIISLFGNNMILKTVYDMYITYSSTKIMKDYIADEFLE